jgi:hypothetical protein
MKPIFILLFTLFSIATFSQSPKNYNIIEGPEMQGKSSSIEKVIGTLGDNILICRKEKNNYFLELIDQNAAIIKSVDVGNLEFEGSKREYVDAFILKNNLFVRFSANDKRNKTIIEIIDEYEAESLSFKRNVGADRKAIDGASELFWYSHGLKQSTDEFLRFGFIISKEHNYAVKYSISFKDKNDNEERVSISVYDENMSIAWEKEYKMPYSLETFKIGRVIVDEKGNIHLYGREFFETTNVNWRDNKNYKHHVISFLDGGKYIRDNKIELDSEFIMNTTLNFTPEDILIASGFYGSKDSYSINGIFSIKIDINKKSVISTNKLEFENLVTESGLTYREIINSGKKENKSGYNELPEFNLKNLVLTTDGGWILMAEQKYYTKDTNVALGPNLSLQNKVTKIELNTDDIMLVRMNNNGEKIWAINIDKHQNSPSSDPQIYLPNSDAKLSYSWLYCNDAMYILYNTAPESSDNLVCLEKISADGSSVKETLMQGGNDELYIIPSYSTRTKDCQLLIYSARKKTYQFSLMNVLN